ncbi:augurin-A [Denticeps clupeoides]|uniref:augurin-A n=1 Tax=Denticeps clupeoides TaxID=299321 RepID=UPI0010A48C38|nr:augurin-A-like [Denticeps clupeoides]
MASLRFYLLLLAITTLTAALHLTDASGKEGLQRLLKKREVPATASGSASAAVVMPSSRAQQFLQSLRRPKRNLWDRNRPDVQQWIQQFMYMGFDEARLETDLAYWKDQSMSTDQGRQHHYDENAALGPRYPTGYRHGANVNYDYY